MSRLAALERFLLSAFDATELRIWLRNLSSGQTISPGLPGPTASLAHLVAEAVGLLERNGYLDDQEVWDALVAERPRRRDEIVVIRDLGGERTPTSTSAGTPSRTSTGTPTPTRMTPTSTSASTPGPIRILFVLSCPPGREGIAATAEIRQIRDELERAPYRDRFAHQLVVAATYGHLRRALRGYQPHILHFVCHGTAGAQLVLDDDNGGEELIDAGTLVELLAVLKRDLQLVVVNACSSTSITHQLAPLVGLVVGMRGAVDDVSAVSFAQVFYESIAAGDSVETSYRLGVNELRRRRLDANLPELLPPSGPERGRRFVAES